MICRKNGETHKQYIRRLETELQNSIENNRALRILNNGLDLANPRTNKPFREEAAQLFLTVALIENQLREGSSDLALMYAQGMLQELGFNSSEIYQNLCLKDDVYTNG
jgi:hypothetical protein